MQKIIGILGGMGPEATLNLYEHIIKNTPAVKDQEHLRVIIDSNPKIPDRTPAILGQGESPVPAMVQSGRVLENAGVDFIIIPCISAHFFLKKLQDQLTTPILSAFEETALAITRHPGGIKRIGLLATSGTIEGGRLTGKLKEFGVEAIVPDEKDQEKVTAAIYTIKGSQDAKVRKECGMQLALVAEHLVAAGAFGIVAGCTEVPLSLFQEDIVVPLFNTIEVLAKAAIARAKV